MKRKGRVPTEEVNKRLKKDAGQVIKERRECPYLSNINREKLNFDNEKKCSVSLKTTNIYMCLVCGGMFHGRGKATPAYTHALNLEHYVFMDTLTGQIWCIPDMYEVHDDSLSDIQHNLQPTYSTDETQRLLTTYQAGHRILDQTEFTVGYVGLNNIKRTDYINSVLQSLVHLELVVRHFMQTFVYKKESRRSALRDSFSELCRKIWNPHNYVGQVSPRFLIEVISRESKGEFDIDKAHDPQKFLHFLLTKLNEGERRALGKGKRTVIEEAFQGRMRVQTKEYMIEGADGADKVLSSSEKEVPFFTLPVTLPSTPLTRDENQHTVQQEHIQVLLQKYNGSAETLKGTGKNKTCGTRYIITELPRYLILFYDRFSSKDKVMEKNRTIVRSPVTNLEIGDICTAEEAAKYTNTRYDLVSTVVHEGPSKAEGFYKTYQLTKQQQQWLEMEDLRVGKSDSQVVSIAPAYIQIWERKGVPVEKRDGPLFDKESLSLIQSFMQDSDKAKLPVLCRGMHEVLKASEHVDTADVTMD